MVHDVFIQAMQLRRLCTLKDDEDRSRLVEPYGVFLTKHNKPMYCCYQLGGHSDSRGIPNWRNFPIDEIAEVILSSRTFQPRHDFKPDNRSIYHQWVEHL